VPIVPVVPFCPGEPEGPEEEGATVIKPEANEELLKPHPTPKSGKKHSTEVLPREVGSRPQWKRKR
jgi:hypothetical protein